MAFSAGLGCMGLTALVLVFTIFAGERVQLPLYNVLVGISTVVLLCLLTEAAVLIWAIIVLSLSGSPRLKSALLNALIKSAIAAAILLVLAHTRLVWVQPAEYAFFQAPVVSPSLFVGGKLFRLSPVLGVATGLLFFGGITLWWVSATVLPVVAALRGGARR